MIFDGDGPKENAAPIIHDVEDYGTNKAERLAKSLGWTQVDGLNHTAAVLSSSGQEQALQYDSIFSVTPSSNKIKNTRNNNWIMMKNNTTNGDSYDYEVEDIAVLRAISDASKATEGKGVSILRNAGIITSIEKPKDNSNNAFVPVGMTSLLLQQRKNNQQQPQTKQNETGSTEHQPQQQQQQKNNHRRDPIDSNEIYEIIRNIQDPEHPLTLEQLGVVRANQIDVITTGDDNEAPVSTTLDVRFTPTIPHCSMATLIGLCIQVKLLRSLPRNTCKVIVRIEPGTHASECDVNKQLSDKERVCAALENKNLLSVVNKCIGTGMAANS